MGNKPFHLWIVVVSSKKNINATGATKAEMQAELCLEKNT